MSEPDKTSMLQTSARPALHKRTPSLFAQMAIGSVVIAVVAVLLVAIITLFAFSVAFKRYQADQMQEETARSAITIGQGKYFSEVNGPAQLRTLVRKRLGTTNIWVMDAYGKFVVEPTAGAAQANQLARTKIRSLQSCSRRCKGNLALAHSATPFFRPSRSVSTPSSRSTPTARRRVTWSGPSRSLRRHG